MLALPLDNLLLQAVKPAVAPDAIVGESPAHITISLTREEYAELVRQVDRALCRKIFKVTLTERVHYLFECEVEPGTPEEQCEEARDAFSMLSAPDVSQLPFAEGETLWEAEVSPVEDDDAEDNEDDDDVDA